MRSLIGRRTRRSAHFQRSTPTQHSAGPPSAPTSRRRPLGDIIENPVRYSKKLSKSNGGTLMVYIDGAKVFAQVGGRLTGELT